MRAFEAESFGLMTLQRFKQVRGEVAGLRGDVCVSVSVVGYVEKFAAERRYTHRSACYQRMGATSIPRTRQMMRSSSFFILRLRGWYTTVLIHRYSSIK